MQILKLRVYLWCKQKLFYLLFFPETLQSTIENVKLSETTVGNDVTVGRWTTVLSWYLCEASNSVGIRQLTQQCNLFDLLFLLHFFMNSPNSPAVWHDSQVSRSRNNLRLLFRGSHDYILYFCTPGTPQTGRTWAITVLKIVDIKLTINIVKREVWGTEFLVYNFGTG